MAAPAPPPPVPRLHAAFLTILPRIELHAQIYFRDLRCPDHQAEAVQETLALSWRYFLRLAERGKDPLSFPTVLAAYAARHVRCGRRLCGQQKGKDVMSPLAQRRHGFTVEPLPCPTAAPYREHQGIVGGQRRRDALEERLRDNTHTPVPEQVAFRLDFPAWRLTHTERTRRIVDGLMAGERTLDLAGAFGLSPARVSQLRRELHDSWTDFCGDRPQGGDRL